MPRPTISDVAKAAQVSTQTVSRVINDNPKVVPSTRRKVLDAIAQLGYEPSHLAQSLASRSTKTLGYLVYDITNPYYGQLVRGIEDAAFQRGFDLIGGNSDGNHDKDLLYLRIFRRKQVDGILAAVADSSAEMLRIWKEASCPVVFLDQFFESDDCEYVTVNNRAASRALVEHLLDLGHRRIGLVRPALNLSRNIQERIAGFHEALAARNLRFEHSLESLCHPQSELGGYRATKELMARDAGFTALVCINDSVAIGAMRAVFELGRSVPEDISIVGFDDVPIASMLRAPLTTVAQPIRTMGQTAVELLLDRIKAGPSRPCHHVELKAELVVRESTSAPRKGRTG